MDFDVDKVFIRNWIENVKVYVEYKIFNVFKFILLRCFFFCCLRFDNKFNGMELYLLFFKI